MYVNSVEFHSNPVMANGTTWLSDNRSINAVFNIGKDLKTMRVVFKVDLTRGRRKFYSINITRDYCDSMKFLKGNGMWQMIYHAFFQVTNFSLSCPIPKSTYYVRKMVFPDHLLPVYMPAVNFVAETKCFFQPYPKVDELFLKYISRGEIIP